MVVVVLDAMSGNRMYTGCGGGRLCENATVRKVLSRERFILQTSSVPATPFLSRLSVYRKQYPAAFERVRRNWSFAGTVLDLSDALDRHSWATAAAVALEHRAAVCV